MKEMIKKIGSLVDTIQAEKGNLTFFALALREESIVWDLLIAANWIDYNRKEALDYLVKKIQAVLTSNELLDLSGIILLNNDYFSNLSASEKILAWEQTDTDLYGVAVKKAYVFIAPEVDFLMNPKQLIKSI